jgi:threonine/homoserine/homoserine lactone efflux protein
MISHPLQAALAISFVVVGLSHILRGPQWQAFFEPMFRNPGGPFYIAMYTLPIGLLIVVTHNHWTWDLGVIVTVYGWASVFKGSLYFLFPAVPLKLITVRMRSVRSFTQAGGILVLLGALLAYDWLLGT